MERRTKAVLLAIALAVAALGIGFVVMAGYVANRSLLAESARSPSGRVAAARYHLREADDPPYGTEVRLERARLLVIPESETVFRGYCTDGSSLSWATPHKLVIHCGTLREVVLHRERLWGVAVEVTTDRPEPERRAGVRLGPEGGEKR